MLKHIVIPLDGSTYSEKALSYGVEMATQAGASVSLVVVVPSYETMNWPGARLPGGRELEEHHRKLAQDYLDKQVRALTEAGVSEVRGVLRCGDIRHEINDYAQLNNADLIVVSTHGLSTGAHGDVTERVMGSTALKILMSASCPVLLVRAAV
jgi:nucleotide-binding universal stress UspA family protein